MDMSIFSSLVLGASTNPNRYSYKAVLSLKQNGYNVIAVGNKVGQIDYSPLKDYLPDLMTVLFQPQYF